MTAFASVRNHRKAKRFIDICSKNSALQCTCSYGRCKKQSLIEGLIDPKRRSDLLSKSGRCQTVSGIFNTVLRSDNIASHRSQTASRILDQRTHGHICSHIGRFDAFHKFTVAVVHHHDEILPDAFHKSNRFADLVYGKCRTSLITFGTLDRNETGVWFDGLTDLLKIKGTILF